MSFKGTAADALLQQGQIWPPPGLTCESLFLGSSPSVPPPSPSQILGVNPRCETSRCPMASVLEELRGRKTVSPSQWTLSSCIRDSDGDGLDPRFESSPQPVSAGRDLMLQRFSGLITTNGCWLQRFQCSGNSTAPSSWNKAHTRMACVIQPTAVEAHAFASASASGGGWAAGQRLPVICRGRVTLRTQCPFRAKTYKCLSPA